MPINILFKTNNNVIKTSIFMKNSEFQIAAFITDPEVVIKKKNLTCYHKGCFVESVGVTDGEFEFRSAENIQREGNSLAIINSDLAEMPAFTNSVHPELLASEEAN